MSPQKEKAGFGHVCIRFIPVEHAGHGATVPEYVSLVEVPVRDAFCQIATPLLLLEPCRKLVAGTPKEG